MGCKKEIDRFYGKKKPQRTTDLAGLCGGNTLIQNESIRYPVYQECVFTSPLMVSITLGFCALEVTVIVFVKVPGLAAL